MVIEQRLSLLELLNMFPSSAPPLALVLDQLAPLAARHYSVSSSPLNPAHASQAHFAFCPSRPAGGAAPFRFSIENLFPWRFCTARRRLKALF